MSASEFVVTAETDGKTVLAALRVFLEGQSWSQVRTLMERRRVTVNGRLCQDEARRVRSGERLALQGTPAALPPTEKQVTVVYKDDDLVVAMKPSGMLSERRMEALRLSPEKRWAELALDEAVSLLLAPWTRDPRQPHIVAEARRAPSDRRSPTTGRLRKTHARGMSNPPPPLSVRSVHRLDRDTSGLLLLARHPQGEADLAQQFAERTVERIYEAVVIGTPEARTITTHLAKDRGDGRRGSVNSDEGGQLATTTVLPQATANGLTLIECRLETGRTNQIRIHLSEAGFPVCGDPKFGLAAPESMQPDLSGTPRLALHAGMLGFTHPRTGERLRFTAPWPEDIAPWIEKHFPGTEK